MPSRKIKFDLERKQRTLLLIGFPPRLEEKLSELFSERVPVEVIGKDDTLSPVLLYGSAICLIFADSNDSLIVRVDAILRDSPLPVPIVLISSKENEHKARSIYPELQVLSEPVNVAYILGLLDSSIVNHEKVRAITQEQIRLESLYEISSALLKVSTRKEIPVALDATLGKVLRVKMVLIALPEDPDPLVYFRSHRLLNPPQIESLYIHVSDSWDVLRPSRRHSWDFLFSLASNIDDRSGPLLSPGDFISTPISQVGETIGFFTVLPENSGNPEESFLQTLFVVGDMLSVVLFNIHLRERMEEKANFDGLTGLWNRQTLFEHLAKECSRSQRYGQPVSIVMLDLDLFKKINDRFGHQAGDAALKFVAAIIRRFLRDSDFAGRCGGEEFIVVLPATPITDAVSWAEKVRKAIASAPLIHEKHEIRVTASLGVCCARGELATVDEMVGEADRALYRAKNNGRNQVQVAIQTGDENRIPSVNG